MLGTCFLDKLEQKVKHVFAPKLVTDQESSIYKFDRGTLVISVFVYCDPYVKQRGVDFVGNIDDTRAYRGKPTV